MRARYFIKSLISAVFFFTILFICAGRLDYLQGLIYVFIGLVMVILSHTLFRIEEDLQKERSKPGENTKKWDKIILLLSLLCTLTMYVVAGFDSGRLGWSPTFHWSFLAIGVIFTVSGQLLFLIAQKQNRFFSSTVRIQKDRNHTVCDSGLYRFVRHPAYMGSIIQGIGFPLLMGSFWSIIPVICLIILFVVRTNLEDKTLIDELEGYNDYSQRIRYRLLPFVW